MSGVKPGNKAVTISLNKQVWKDFQEMCLRMDVKPSPLIEDVLRGMIAQWRKERKPEEKKK